MFRLSAKPAIIRRLDPFFHPISANKLFVSESSGAHQKSVTVILVKPSERSGRKMKPKEDSMRRPQHRGCELACEPSNHPDRRSDSASRSRIENWWLGRLRSATSSSQAEGFKFVKDASIDLLILSADLADVQCCDALTEVKQCGHRGTRVILLTQGGGAERARASISGGRGPYFTVGSCGIARSYACPIARKTRL